MEHLNNKSRVIGDYHARFCESLEGKFLGLLDLIPTLKNISEAKAIDS